MLVYILSKIDLPRVAVLTICCKG